MIKQETSPLTKIEISQQISNNDFFNLLVVPSQQLPKISNRNLLYNPVVVIDQCPVTAQPSHRDQNHGTTFQTFDEVNESTVNEVNEESNSRLESKLHSQSGAIRINTLKSNRSDSKEGMLEKYKKPESVISSRRSLVNLNLLNLKQG